MSSSEAKKRLTVQVIIVSYKTADLVKTSLSALADERAAVDELGIDVRCYVIDNSGVDLEPVQAFVQEKGWQPWLHVVQAERNGGFAYGNNRGFEYGLAQSPKPDYFFLLNPDAVVRPGAISQLVEFMETHPRAGSAGSRLENERGELWPVAFRFPGMLSEVIPALQFGPLYRLFADRMVARTMGDKTEEVDWFPGAAMICRASVIEELGGMDESYFLYYEETDFCLKLKRHGWTNWYVPASRVMHIAGKSTGVTSEGADVKRLPSYWFESRRRYFLKNYGKTYAVCTDALTTAANLAGEVQMRLRGKPEKLREGFLRDFWRGSALQPANRAIEPERELLTPRA